MVPGACGATGAAWLEGRGGQPEGCCHRQMMIDAIRYLVAGDAQSVKAAATVPAATCGFDGGTRSTAARGTSWSTPWDCGWS
jgi:hypothetical protein